MKRFLPVLAALSGAAILQAAPAYANHVKCGDAIMQDTVLDSDLKCSGINEALLIVASNITLDLNGHSITSTSTGAGTGIVTAFGLDIHGVTIKDGTVKGFFRQILIHVGSHDNTVEGIAALDGGPGGRGIELLGGANRNVIKENTTSGNAFGILLETFGGTADFNLIKENDVSGNSAGGIVLLGGTGNVIRENVVSNNVGPGGGGSSGCGSSTIGIELRPGPSGTVIKENEANGNGCDGINVQFGNPGTVIKENEANGNGRDGIHTDTSGTAVTENSANDNFRFGIFAPAANDGGGNTAEGNGTANCVGVSCEDDDEDAEDAEDAEDDEDDD